MKSVLSHISESGRISVPAEFRRALGLERGGDVVVELEGRDIRIRTVDEVVLSAQKFAQDLLRGHKTGSVDAFLAEKRKEAGKE